jgi:hypothetical protein
MKTRTSQFLLIALFITATLLLSACKVNFITSINSDGSGKYTQEIGFEDDEASIGGVSINSDDFCAKQSTDLPDNTTTRKETRNEKETWCIYETPFKSLEDLKAIYGKTDTRINDISLVDGKLTYDISLDMSGDSSAAPLGSEVYWNLNLPGRVIEHNATEQNGSSYKWKLAGGQVNNIRAVSQTGGLNFDGSLLWYVLGGGAFLCLCCFLPLVIVGVVFFLLRRKKSDPLSVEPAAQPVEQG